MKSEVLKKESQHHMIDCFKIEQNYLNLTRKQHPSMMTDDLKSGKHQCKQQAVA